VTGKTMDLGLRQRTCLFVGMTMISSVCGHIFLALTGVHLSWWQHCISVLAGMHTTFLPVFWYLMCCGLARAAKRLGDEVEQV
jgi:hypothetical protein